MSNVTVRAGRRPTISVIVPTRNRPAELGEALASVAGQQGVDLADVEVIVVNDGGSSSIDGQIERARQLGLMVRSMAHPRRRGLPAARNTGMDRARGEYLVFLDDDDLLLPDHLVTALHRLETNTDPVQAVATTCLVIEHRVDPTTPTAMLLDQAQVWDIPWDPVLLEVCNLIPVHTAVVRTPPPQARFDERLPALEDWDFWLRLTREHGYEFTRISEPTVVYHRLPAAPSMIGDAASGAAALARFSTLVRRVWYRWPATTARAVRARHQIGCMYWQALAQLATGQLLNPHYYLHTVRAVSAAWRDPAAETGLIEQLHRIVRGEHHGERSAA